jgi:hypothetical protein
MAFEDVQKRMAKRGPSPLWIVLAVAGLAFVGLNFVVNEVLWEDADFGGAHPTTYVPLGVGIVCLVASALAKWFPRVVTRFAVGLVGLGLVGFNVLLDEWSRSNADARGVYWVSHTPAALGIMLLFSAVFLGGPVKR